MGFLYRTVVWDSCRTLWDSCRTLWDSCRTLWDSCRTAVWDSCRILWDSYRTVVWDSCRNALWDSYRTPVWDSYRNPCNKISHESYRTSPSRIMTGCPTGILQDFFTRACYRFSRSFHIAKALEYVLQCRKKSRILTEETLKI